MALVESGDAQRQARPPGASRASSPARVTPQEVVDARGLTVVSDDGALIAAIDAALAAQPDVLEKIREGKVQAAGAIIGAVMKAMGGSGGRGARARAGAGAG